MPPDYARISNESKIISTLLPQVNLEEIRNFMTNLPHTYHNSLSNLRVALTLTHFYKLEDNKNLIRIRKENNNYADSIHNLFPTFSVNKILKKLQKYGSVPDRPRLVLKNILKNNREEINTILYSLKHKHQKVTSENISDSDDEPEVIELKPLDKELLSVFQNPVPDVNNEITHINLELEHYDLDLDTDNNFCETPYGSNSKNTFVSELNENLAAKSLKDAKIHEEDKMESEINNCCSNYTNPTWCLPSTSKISCQREVVPPNITENNFQRNENDNYQIPGDTLKDSNQIGLEIECDNQPRKSEEDCLIMNAPPPCTVTCDEGTEKQITLNLNFERSINSSNQNDEQKPGTSCSNDSENNSSKPNFESLVLLVEKHVDSFKLKHSKDTSEEPVAKKPKIIMLNSIKNISNMNTANGTVNSIETYSKADDGERNKVVYKVMEIFPDADSNYVKNIVYKRPKVPTSTEIIDIMLLCDYPKREVVPVEEKEIDINERERFARELLPDIDPNFLKMKLVDLNQDEISIFISEALENKNYPTLKDYNRKQQLSAQKRQYTSEFSVENFVKLVPDPQGTFSNPNRNLILNGDDRYFIKHAIRNKFSFIAARDIERILVKNNYKPYKSNIEIKKIEKKYFLKSRRPKTDLNGLNCENIPLIQEVTYVLYEDEINNYLIEISKKKEEKRAEAKSNGLMLSCCCCYEDEVMPEDSYNCPNNCIICHQCIIRSTEIAFGEGRVNFPCIGDCGVDLHLNTLQNILPPNLFSKIAQKQTVAEVKAADIENLEFCPFCDFASIPPGPPEEFKIFGCQNPECLKETCRLCKEPSHVPLRCDEIEKDEDVKKRVFIENKMTEGLLRKCWKCGMKFFKEEGCNKMTCVCGAAMCYVCNKPVDSYKHFNGLGGDQLQLCPLYSDSVSLNKRAVKLAADEAKKEIGVAGPSNLKNDPTLDIDDYFNKRSKELPREPHLEVLQNPRLHPHLQARQLQREDEMQRHRVQMRIRQFEDQLRDLNRYFQQRNARH